MKTTKYSELSTVQKLRVLKKYYGEAAPVNDISFEDTVEHLPGTGGVISLSRFEKVIRGLTYRDPAEFDLELIDNLYVALDLNDLTFIKDLWEYHIRETANEAKKSEEEKQTEERNKFFKDLANMAQAADGHN